MLQAATLHSAAIQAQVVRVITLSTISFLIAMFSVPLWVRALKRFGAVKQIRTRKEAPIYNRFHEKKAGTLTGGGVIFWSTTVFLALALWVMGNLWGGVWSYLSFIDRKETYLPLAALLVAAILGFVDDWMGIRGIGGANGGGLKIRYKSIIYLIVSAVGAWWFFAKLDWTVLQVPFVGPVEIGWWYVPFFMFIIFASAFSANETDGLDGLLGGTALFTFGALTTVAFLLGRFHLAAFGGVLIGALLAFLWHNIYPAKYFMGDTGSMSLGITIGVIAMLTNTPLLLPFFAFIFVLESLSVIIQLLSKKLLGKKVFLSTPIHHHFEALGWHESQVTMRFWIISAIASAIGLIIFIFSLHQ
ncbi:phospho-N-acetylmuramoyl-pentapeptide-transferase [Candidatus Parcubacteria bacterium]|nr:MAG: phospho-N-acetylmuramoyl-pentapeptide-transferase [Candidatus Parcubacteria bacterium]